MAEENGGTDENANALPGSQPRRVVRVITPGKPAFLLQKGEVGLSVFDP